MEKQARRFRTRRRKRSRKLENDNETLYIYIYRSSLYSILLSYFLLALQKANRSKTKQSETKNPNNNSFKYISNYTNNYSTTYQISNITYIISIYTFQYHIISYFNILYCTVLTLLCTVNSEYISSAKFPSMRRPARSLPCKHCMLPERKTSNSDGFK